MDPTLILYDEHTCTQYRPPIETPWQQRKRRLCPELGTAVAWFAVLSILGIVIMTAGGYWPSIGHGAVRMLHRGHSTSHANTSTSMYVFNLRDGVTEPPVDVRALTTPVVRERASSLAGTPTIKPPVVSRPTPSAAKSTQTPAMSSPVPSTSTTPSPSVSPTAASPSVSPTTATPSPTGT